MFDIGFWELSIIAVVALLVVGPERLPKLARTAGLWLGRARRFVSSVKADIDREIAAEELKKTLAKQAESTGLYDILEDTKKTIESDLNSAADEPEQPAKAVDKPEQPAKAVTDKTNDTNG